MMEQLKVTVKVSQAMGIPLEMPGVVVGKVTEDQLDKRENEARGAWERRRIQWMLMGAYVAMTVVVIVMGYGVLWLLRWRV